MQHDKLKHFFFGFLIFCLAGLFCNNWIALGVVAVVAIAKEVYDKKSGTGQYELLDIVYSLAPGLLIILKDILC